MDLHRHPVAGEPAGLPMLLVPGAFSDADSFEDAGRWLASRGHEAHVLSPPSRRRSLPQLDTGGLAGLDAAVDEACERIDGPLVAVGHSLGGLAVLRLLGRRDIAAAALLMPVPPDGLGGEVRRLITEQPVDAAKMAVLTATSWPVRNLPLNPPRGMFGEDVSRETIERSMKRRVSESWRLLGEALVGTRTPIEPVRTPLLLIGGSGDSIVSAAAVSRLAERLGAPYREFDVGHAFAEEPGFERVFEAIVDWLPAAGAGTEPGGS